MTFRSGNKRPLDDTQDKSHQDSKHLKTDSGNNGSLPAHNSGAASLPHYASKATVSASPSLLPPALRAKLAARGIVPPASVTAQQSSVAAGGAAAPAGAPLPPGWLEAFDTTYYHPYWYNKSTGERTWTRPELKPQLPPGWTEAQDPSSGHTYYFNAATGVTQWERPEDTNTHYAQQAQQPKLIVQPNPVGELYYPCPSFMGERLGYVFKLGPSGMGYYLDSPDTNTLLGEARPVVEEQPVASRRPTIAEEQAERNRLVQEERERRLQRKQQQAQQGPGSGSRGGGGGRGRGRGRKKDDALDPMDPSSYSDAPRGGWGAGLEGVDRSS